jgi:myosin heavy subunit
MYDIMGFLDKNRDSINPDVVAIFWESKSEIVTSLFKTSVQPESIGKKMTLKVMKKATHKGTVAGHFKVCS